MNRVPKQRWMGCALAAAAMLADPIYDEVAAHWPDLDEAVARSPRGLCALLEAVTDAEWQWSPCWHSQQPVHSFPVPPWPVAEFIQDAGLRPRFGQRVVLNDGTVYDPGEWTAHAVQRHPRRDCVVTGVAKPTRSLELNGPPAPKRGAGPAGDLQTGGS